ncbi:MAG: epoxyqueuosine reductase QueH [Lachnospiraceae bacterium]|nr:epoxyqueuosine reductase QueH [Lachnospiraceae bacterium]
MRNYQRELEELLEDTVEREKERRTVPRLFLHSCCAPCSSYVLEYLSAFFSITVFYYNPNIGPKEEYEKRVVEQERLLSVLSERVSENGEDRRFYPITFIKGAYEPEAFYEAARGLEDAPEGGARCMKCYELRLRKAAELAKAGGYDYFCTTLSISPLKKAGTLMEIGECLAEEYGVAYLPSDFKKKDGYKRSVMLSEEFGLYRQNYCGCIFSRREAEKKEIF